MELNPNHPVTQKTSDHWHKIVALLMLKFNQPHVEITLQDIEKLANGHSGAVSIQEKNDRIILNLVSWEEGERLAQQEGGLPH